MSQPTIAAARAARPAATVSPLTPARVSFAAAGLFLALLAVLHVLRPDLDPSWNPISAYGLGRHGWVMSLAFASLGISCAALVAALWPHATRRAGRSGLALLSVCAVGLALAALFPTDPIQAAPPTTRGQLHEAGALLGGLLPIAAVLVTWALSRHAAWSPFRRWLWLATALVWLGDALFIASMAAMMPAGGGLGPGVLIGWPNRFMIVTYCVWLMVVARRAGSLPGEVAP